MTRYRLIIFFEIILLLILVSGKFLDIRRESASSDKIQIEEYTISAENETKDFIKWVDFTVSCEALELASGLDIKAHEEGKELDWIRLLSYAAAKNGGEFGKNSLKAMERIAEEAVEKCGKKTPSEWLDVTAANLKYYEYYKEAYGAVLSGMLGYYRIQEEGKNGQTEWVDKYGIKAFSPIAKGFDYSDYDDFGSARSYGYSRPHLGHDMMGQVGTPIRIKNRACASQNDAQAFSIKYTTLNDLFDRFVFTSITDIFKVIKKIADIFVDDLFLFFQTFFFQVLLF